MRLPFRRRRRTGLAGALDVLGVVVVARATPWRALGVLALLGAAGGLVARLARGGGDGDAGQDATSPWTPPVAEVPGDATLDVDGPNESAPGHHPTEADRRAS
jgi:hypothetical protein